jgi:hypothetical protein
MAPRDPPGRGQDQARGAPRASASEGMSSSDEMRLIGRSLNGLAVVAGIWAAAAPGSACAVGAAFLIPLLAIALLLLGRNTFRVLEARDDPRPRIWVALFVPPFLASIRVFELRLMEPIVLLPPALAGGAVLTAVAAIGDRSLRERPLPLVGVLTLMVGMAASGLTFANCIRDTSPAAEYEVPVLAKWGSGGNRPVRALRLGRWGQRTAPSNLHVRRDLWEAVSTGEHVSVLVRGGRFGLPWFMVAPGRIRPEAERK